MSTEAWPFLVSRNRTLDNRTLVAPQFMIGTEGPVLIQVALDKPGDGPGKVIYRVVHIPSIGNISLFFQMVTARHQHIGKTGDKPLLERDGGRAFFLYEGVVVKGVKPHQVVTDGDLQLAHERVQPVFKAFWKVTSNDSFTVMPSEPFLLATQRPPNLRISRRTRVIILSAVLIFFLLAGVVLFLLLRALQPSHPAIPETTPITIWLSSYLQML